MAKKKSKTQKKKQNIKKKTQSVKTKVTEAKNSTKKTSKTLETPIVETKKVSKRVVDKNKVKYNVLFTAEALKKISKKKKENKKTTKIETLKQKLNIVISFLKKYILLIINFIKKYTSIVLKHLKAYYKKTISFIKKYYEKLKIKLNKKTSKKKPTKPKKKTVSKKKQTQKEEPPKNLVKKIFYILKNNLHIAFNALLIITFVILLTGLIRTRVFTTGSIVYISCIALFLMIVAMSYTKYLSGKIYSLFIACCMFAGIHYMQYTYDFINNLNTSQYEYKEYYIVTFNNGRNKSIYNINNKKVGLLKDNSTNIQRILNIKLDSINYIEYEDQNAFYEDFYNQEYRAIIVNDNQYKYLTNNISDNSRSVKILYKFQANAKK